MKPLLSLALPLLLAGLAQSLSTAPKSAKSWLDSPLATWNKVGAAIPRAPASDETTTSIVKRCKLTPPRATAAERAVDAAGWIPYWNFDQQLVRDDIEIVGGMRGADDMCRPKAYNLFVFVGGKFAGLLSPAAMNSRTDSSSGTVRIQAPNITADFSRYANADALCCPSSHVTVRYRIDRVAAGAVVVPIEVRPRN